eukprot:gene19774-6925_t
MAVAFDIEDAALAAFKKAKDSTDVQILKLQISDKEIIELKGEYKGDGGLEANADLLKTQMMEEPEPCYFVVNADAGKDWILISFLREGSHPKKRMIQ